MLLSTWEGSWRETYRHFGKQRPSRPSTRSAPGLSTRTPTGPALGDVVDNLGGVAGVRVRDQRPADTLVDSGIAVRRGIAVDLRGALERDRPLVEDPSAIDTSTVVVDLRGPCQCQLGPGVDKDTPRPHGGGIVVNVGTILQSDRPRVGNPPTIGGTVVVDLRDPRQRQLGPGGDRYAPTEAAGAVVDDLRGAGEGDAARRDGDSERWVLPR